MPILCLVSVKLMTPIGEITIVCIGCMPTIRIHLDSYAHNTYTNEPLFIMKGERAKDGNKNQQKFYANNTLVSWCIVNERFNGTRPLPTSGYLSCVHKTGDKWKFTWQTVHHQRLRTSDYLGEYVQRSFRWWREKYSWIVISRLSMWAMVK